MRRRRAPPLLEAAVALTLLTAVRSRHEHDHRNDRRAAFHSAPCVDGVYASVAGAHVKICDRGYTLRVDAWHSRLGNTLHQLTNALYVARATRSTLDVPPADLLARTRWDFRDANATACGACRAVVVTGGAPHFWHPRDCPLLARADAAAKRDVVTRFILPELLLPPAGEPDGTLVVYLRSGDVFRGDGSSGWYVQPPLAFYRAVLRRKRWPRAVVVTDHSDAGALNPVLSRLVAEFPFLVVTPASLAQDVATLVAATHVVGGRSTLIDTLLLAGPPKRCAYLPECPGNQGALAAAGVCYRFDGYTPQGSWANSDAQRRAMIDFDERSVRETVWGGGSGDC